MLLGEQIQAMVHLGILHIRQGNRAGAVVKAVKILDVAKWCNPRPIQWVSFG